MANPLAASTSLRRTFDTLGGSTLAPSNHDYSGSRTATPPDLHWLLAIRHYHVLPTAEAERLLQDCLCNMSTIVSEVFTAEVEAVMTPAREITQHVMTSGLNCIVDILQRLPESSFVGADGKTPDPQFHNVVRGLCHLWLSTDTNQLSSVMRHISITRPAGAVSQVAKTKKIRLPAKQRALRMLTANVASKRLLAGFYLTGVLLAVSVIAAVAGLLAVLPTAAAIAITATTGAASLCGTAYVYVVTATHRDAGDAVLRAARDAIAGGVLTMVMPSELAGEPTLAKAQHTSPSLSAAAAGQNAVGGGGGVGLRQLGVSSAAIEGGPDSAAHHESLASIRFKFPHGVLLLPQSPTPSASDGANHQQPVAEAASTSGIMTWVCVDARAVNRAAIIVGLDTERNITLWNPSAEETTGYVAKDALGQKATLRLSLKGDALFKLPRLVGESVGLGLHTLASGQVQCDALVCDVRNLSGDGVGFAFVAPAAKESNRQAFSFLHEYHWHELTTRATNLEFSAKQLRDCLKAPSPAGGTVATAAADEGGGSGARQGSGGPMASQEARKSSPWAVGSPLVSANPQVNLHDIALVANTILRQASSLRVEIRQLGWDALNNMARAIATEWEWTNGERLLGAAAKYHFSKASVRTDASLPASFRLPPAAARIAKALVTYAPSHCRVTLHYQRLSSRVGRISAEVALSVDSGQNSTAAAAAAADNRVESRWSLGRQSINLDTLRLYSSVQLKFDTDRLMKEVAKDISESCASFHVGNDDTVIVVNFPCVRDVNNVDSADTGAQDVGRGGTAMLPPTVATVVDCVVAVCLEQPVEQHNLGMLLLGVKGVSLSLCRDVDELASRIKTLDIIIIANSFRDRILVHEDVHAVVIPVVEELAPFDDDHPHIRLPFDRSAVLDLLVAASEVVAETKRLQREAKERDDILQARHDAPWRKGALLGRGSFGTVYVAVNELTEGKMAVKQFDYSGRAEAMDAAMDALMNEIKILTKLDHPNIVHYLYCERTASCINLFMELCDASVANLIRRRRRLGDAYRAAVPVIMHQTLLAVAYLHHLNIVHRDIKPQNMLIKGDKVKLSDFGTAHQAANGEQLKDTQGTFRFMAPEVFQAKAYNQTCDTWSIGCVLCELLDVKLPFMQPGAHYMLADLRQTDVSLSHAVNLTHEEKEFILVCLQVQKEFRPDIATLLMHPYVQNLPSSSCIAAMLQPDDDDDDDAAGPPRSLGSEVSDGDGFTLVSNA